LKLATAKNMVKKVKIYFIFPLFLASFHLFGQLEVPKYPVRFAQYYNNLSLINPSTAGMGKDMDFTLGNKKHLGNLSKISTYYLNLNMRINASKASMNAPFSTIGTFFYNDREGKYLNRTRFYVTYAWHGNITKNIKVAGGFHVGGMNYSVKGTPLSGNGSDFTYDGAVGFSLYSKWFYLGGSYNQIFNSSIQPLEEIALLTSFYDVSGSFTLKPIEIITVRGFFSYRIYNESETNLADATLLVTYNNKIEFAMGLHTNNRIINSFELKNVFNDVRNLNICLTYAYPFKPTNLNTNFLEIGIKYCFNRKLY
jgi:hypothetical protein